MLLAGCSPRPDGARPGYLEGEFVYVAAPLGGALTNLAVRRGVEVKAGQLLFALEATPEAASLREAEQRLAQAQARLENLTKGRRPSELAGLTSQLERAEANLRWSDAELQRRRQLSDGNVISAAELDLAQTRQQADRAQLAALAAELETARLGARTDEIRAAAAEAEGAVATVARAQWAVAQKHQYAPTNAWVHDTLYRPGEWVAAGSPVVVLLPPENVKVRFFIPETALASVHAGQRVTVSFDGAPAPFAATVHYIATQAEFTPPVIYSKENRAKLVYMVEARFEPADARTLRPGQPVDVRLGP